MDIKNISNQNEESQYTQIQFIGLCLSTTPGDLTSIEGTSDDGRYLGLPTMKDDIAARITLVINLLKDVRPVTEKDTNTLKVFVLPEFFFRGNMGAYPRSTAETPYGFFRAKFGELIKFMQQDVYENCLLVAGSVLSSAIAYNANEKTEPGKSLCVTGDSLLNVYYRLHPKLKEGTEGGNHPSMHELLKMIDQGTSEDLDKVPNEDRTFVDVLKRTLDNCDTATDIVVDNSAYVIFGGKNAPAPKRIQKKYKSKEDFVLNRYFTDNATTFRTGYLQSNTKYDPIEDKTEIKKDAFDPYAIFYYGGIWFGIDICLDHSRQRLADELKRNTSRFVDVQIITSCGMEIYEKAVTAKQGNWVFNCDGEYELKTPVKGVDGPNCHSSLRKVKTQLGIDDHGNITEEAVLFNAEKNPDIIKIVYKNMELFYPATECYAHIYPPHPVHEPKTE